MKPTLLRIIALLSLIASASFLFADAKILIKGKVVDETGQPLPAVNVFIINTFEGAMTDTNGVFSFSAHISENSILAASCIGYKKTTVKLAGFPPGIPVTITLYPDVITTKEVIVTASSFSSEKEKGIVMTSMDVITTPGGAADIFQTLKTVPGITQVSESAELYVRGGDPFETTTILDQATLNHPYTFESAYGGIFSNINTSLIKGMYFSSGGFSAKYGNALSGVLDLSTKDEPLSTKTDVGLSLAYAGIHFETPLVENKLGIRLVGRKSFIKPIFAVNGGLDEFTIVPESDELNGQIIYKYSKTGRIKLFGLYGQDKEGVNIEQPGYRDEFNGDSRNSLYNINLTDIIFSDILLTSGLSLSEYNNHWQLGNLDLRQDDKLYKSRTDLEYRFSRWLKFSGGFEANFRNVKFKGEIPENDYDMRINGPVEILNTGYKNSGYGIWFETEFSEIPYFNNFFIISGTRYDNIPELKNRWFDERLSLGYRVSPSTTFSIAAGTFHQNPEPRLFSRSDGNPELKPMKAIHLIAAWDYKADGNNIRVEVYYKKYSSLPLENDILNYSNDGYGFARGIDLLYKGSILGIDGWISYGFIDTKRKWMDFESESPSDYDITHNLSVVAKYNLTNAFQLGMNFKYATGKPYKPVTESKYISDRDVYEPVYGRRNSVRFPDYVRLDLRLTYLLNLFNNFTVFYVEGLNILDIKNIFDYSYNIDYSEKSKVSSYFGRRTVVFGIQMSI